MNAYTINTDTMTVAGRFDAVESADRFGQDQMSSNYIVVTDAQDLTKLMSRQDMVNLYNHITDASLVKFGTKEEGAKRLMDAMDTLDLVTLLPEPPVKAPRAKREAKEPGYRGHRKGSKKAGAHEKFDDLFAQGKSRTEIVREIVECGVQENTAKSWYQAFRRTALSEKTA